MLSCEEAVDQLWRHLETDAVGGGTAGARGSDPDLDGHLALCRQCCGEADFAQMLRELWISSSVDALPDDVGARFERFLSELSPDGGSDAGNGGDVGGAR